MTLKFNNVYINETSLVVGPFVKDGPLKNFDKVYNDFYNGEKTGDYYIELSKDGKD